MIFRFFRFTIPSVLPAVLAVLFFSGFVALRPASAQSSSLSLTPAVIMAKGTFGQSLTQKLTINNNTPATFRFDMMAEDVVVKNGKRVFVPAGESPDSIAASAVFSPKEIVAPPHTSATVQMTITLPRKTSLRAMVAVFHTKRVITTDQKGVGLTASIGALVTFNLTSDVAIGIGPLQIHPPTDTTNLSMDTELTNTGTEPVLPKGTGAILNSQGHLVGKAPFTIKRLLPREKLDFHAEYPGTLPAGSYRALCTFVFGGKTQSVQSGFTIQ
jgi:hypothetical protein